MNSEIFHFKREKEPILERITEIVGNEGRFLSRSMIEELVDSFSWDIRAILNYLEVLFMKDSLDEDAMTNDLITFKDEFGNYFDLIK